jgi:predicted RNA-binding Zn-ribbon protein involved in translation (DUF1610 family)
VKKCAYCDRANEDDAVRCRDCGTIEFNDIVVLPIENELDFHPALSGAVRSVTSLEPNEALGLLKRLRIAGIPSEPRPTTLDGVIEFSDIVVPEDNYSQACDVVEAWYDDQNAERQKDSRTGCPNCGWVYYERVPHDRVDNLFRCTKCGHEYFKG